MPNPIKGEVPLTLQDGREFTLLLDAEAFVEAEVAYGKPMHRLLQDSVQGFLSAGRAVLYGALRCHHRDISLREASDILLKHRETVTAALEEAINAVLLDPSEGGNEPNPPQPKVAPNGKTSGGNGAKSGSSRKRSGEQLPATST